MFSPMLVKEGVLLALSTGTTLPGLSGRASAALGPGSFVIALRSLGLGPRRDAGWRYAVADAYARPTASRRRKSGGAIHPRLFRHRVRVVTNQRPRLCRATDAATSHVLEARAASGYERGPIFPAAASAAAAAYCRPASQVATSEATDLNALGTTLRALASPRFV